MTRFLVEPFEPRDHIWSPLFKLLPLTPFTAFDTSVSIKRCGVAAAPCQWLFLLLVCQRLRLNGWLERE